MAQETVSVLWYFGIMLLLVLFAGFIVKKIKFFRDIVESESSERYESLDGLRGFLAMGVFFQHAVQNYEFFQNGIWQITDERFYRFLGGEAVILFFITTSFLYWSKLLANSNSVSVLRLYRNRLLRLAPLYVFAGAVVSLVAIYNTNFSIAGTLSFFRDIFYWLTLGLQTITTFNGYDIIPINSGIHWTLHYEWVFYLLLPLIALLYKNNFGKIIAVFILVGFMLMPDRGYWAIFLFGILASYVVYYFPKVSFFKKYAWSAIIPIVGLLLVYLINYKPYSYVQYAVSCLVFLCFVYGNNLFGLLKIPAAKFLSTISYSVYLLHGIVLYFVLNSLDKIYPITSLDPLVYWSVVFISGIIVIIISALTYRFIEHPFIQKIKPKNNEPMPVTVVDRVI